jgi:hypothetical protein
MKALKLLLNAVRVVLFSVGGFSRRVVAVLTLLRILHDRGASRAHCPMGVPDRRHRIDRSALQLRFSDCDARPDGLYAIEP